MEESIIDEIVNFLKRLDLKATIEVLTLETNKKLQELNLRKGSSVIPALKKLVTKKEVDGFSLKNLSCFLNTFRAETEQRIDDDKSISKEDEGKQLIHKKLKKWKPDNRTNIEMALDSELYNKRVSNPKLSIKKIKEGQGLHKRSGSDFIKDKVQDSLKEVKVKKKVKKDEEIITINDDSLKQQRKLFSMEFIPYYVTDCYLKRFREISDYYSRVRSFCK